MKVVLLCSVDQIESGNRAHISVYDGSLKGLCKMIELILGKKLEPNHLQNVLARTNVSRLGLQYIKKIEIKYC